MANYTVILHRKFDLSDALECENDTDFYIAKVGANSIKDAVFWAKLEVIKADKQQLKPMGYSGRAAERLTDPDGYEVITVIEGHPKILHHPGTTPLWT